MILRHKQLGTGVATQFSEQCVDEAFQSIDVLLGFIKTQKELAMNWDRIEGNWKQFKGKVKEKWGKLTDDELDKIAGRRDQLAGKIQQSYGISRDEADRQVQDWEARL